MCLSWNMPVLPGGYAGDLQLWLAQFELADGSSPVNTNAAHKVYVFS